MNAHRERELRHSGATARDVDAWPRLRSEGVHGFGRVAARGRAMCSQRSGIQALCFGVCELARVDVWAFPKQQPDSQGSGARGGDYPGPAPGQRDTHTDEGALDPEHRLQQPIRNPADTQFLERVPSGLAETT
jgi:hypothetical protein